MGTVKFKRKHKLNESSYQNYRKSVELIINSTNQLIKNIREYNSTMSRICDEYDMVNDKFMRHVLYNNNPVSEMNEGLYCAEYEADKYISFLEDIVKNSNYLK